MISNESLVDQSAIEHPTFTVLIPTYNQANFLPAALDSLLAQTYSSWEAIVVNDGSTDSSETIAEAYATRDRRIRFFNKMNGGTASALNEGLRHSKGDWICWLSSRINIPESTVPWPILKSI